MKLNLKMLAVSTALLGLLAAGAALPASAASPLNAAAALSLPWSAAAVESVETGSYASTMTVGTQQQLSPVIHELMARAIAASESEMVTVAMKRIDMNNPQDDMLVHVRRPEIQLDQGRGEHQHGHC